MKVEQIVQAIEHSGLSNEDLNRVIEAVKYARRQQQRASIRALQLGDNVQFASNKLGRVVTGHVTKIAIKYVTVRTITGSWRVPANMLTKIEDPVTV